MTAREDHQRVVEAAAGRGGDLADLFLERARHLTVELEEGRVKRLAFGVRQGAGVRVVVGSETGYVHSDDPSPVSLMEAARVASRIVREGHAPLSVSLSAREAASRFEEREPLQSVAESRKVALVRAADEAARSYDPRVREVSVTYGEEVRERVVASSTGVWVRDRSPLVRLAVSVLALGNGARQSGFHAVSRRAGFEFFTEEVSSGAVAREAARQAVAMLDSVEAPAGEMPVVLTNGWGGVLLHEAVGHGLEGDHVRTGNSYYAGRLGTPVASELVTVVDDGTLPGFRGSLNFDDEGTPTERTLLIDRGRLVGFMYDLVNARLMKTGSTGNGRRESFRHPPLPRMTNTFMRGGETPVEDILRDTPRGLYVRSLGGGSVDTTTGDFNFDIREAYLIEKGRSTRPVRGATLIGNGPEVLKRVDAVGPDEDCGVGTCGKGGQWVPVCVGQPTLRIASITVGGTRAGG